MFIVFTVLSSMRVLWPKVGQRHVATNSYSQAANLTVEAAHLPIAMYRIITQPEADTHLPSQGGRKAEST